MDDSLKVEKLGIVLRPTSKSFEVGGVLNPAVYQEGDFVHLFYRAVDKNSRSSVGYAKLKGPLKLVERYDAPLLCREYKYEKMGIEDPRIVRIDNIFYLTYVAYDGKNARIAYAFGQDFRKLKKGGIISPQITYNKAAHIFENVKLKDRYFMFKAYLQQEEGKDVLLWEKDACLFPKKIKGKFALIHRILPDIQIIYFADFNQLKHRKFWNSYLKNLSKFIPLENKYWFESRNIGGGAPPIQTKEGWVFIFHTVEEVNKAKIYHASAALLSRRNPSRVIGRLNHPLFSPEKKWEIEGRIPNVVFPTGTAIFGNDLYIYYGAADAIIGVAKINLKKLVSQLKEKQR